MDASARAQDEHQRQYEINHLGGECADARAQCEHAQPEQRRQRDYLQHRWRCVRSESAWQLTEKNVEGGLDVNSTSGDVWMMMKAVSANAEQGMTARNAMWLLMNTMQSSGTKPGQPATRMYNHRRSVRSQHR